MPRRWYYQHRGQTHGPVSPEEIKLLAGNGLLDAVDMLWPEGVDPILAFPAGIILDNESTSPSKWTLKSTSTPGPLPEWLNDVALMMQKGPAAPTSEKPDWLDDVAKLEQASPPSPTAAQAPHSLDWIADLAKAETAKPVASPSAISRFFEGMVDIGQESDEAKARSSETAIPIAEPVAPPPQAAPIKPLREKQINPAVKLPSAHVPSDKIPMANPVTPPKVHKSIPLKSRYILGERLSQRGPIERFQGEDCGVGNQGSLPVILVRCPLDSGKTDPSPIHWEKSLLEKVHSASLPQVLDGFVEHGFEYLVETHAAGRPLLQAWKEPAATHEMRFGWLKQIALTMQHLHKAGAVLTAIRPDIITVASNGLPVISDLSDLQKLSSSAALSPPQTNLLYTAPDWFPNPAKADGRAALYSFGALCYALHLGRELKEEDFERPYTPQPFLSRFPDAHPQLGRLLHKTFVNDPNARFPTEESAKEDPGGFAELLRTLDNCQRSLDNVRLDVAARSATSATRQGDTGCFTILHHVGSFQDNLDESCLVLFSFPDRGLVQTLRTALLQHPMLSGAVSTSASSLPIDFGKQLIRSAMQEAYRTRLRPPGNVNPVWNLKVVYVAGRNMVIGSIGNDRVFLLRDERLKQLVPPLIGANRSVASNANIEPDMIHSILRPGDWILIGSAGVFAAVSSVEIEKMFHGGLPSASAAARRLVNYANHRGANDDATIIVIRTC